MTDTHERQPGAARAGEPRPAAAAHAEGAADAARGAGGPDADSPRRPQSERTLDALVELVRRVTRADTASVAVFSAEDRTATWKAASGFRTLAGGDAGARDFKTPLRGAGITRVAEALSLVVLEGVGASDELPAEDFPLHSAEGVLTVAVAPLYARGERLGALVVGYRSAHAVTGEERETLEGLAGMAALALDNARLLETVIAGKKIWEQTFDAIPDGIIVHDARMRITRSNEAAAEMMGFDSPAQTIGLSCAAAFGRLFGERAAAYHMTPRAGTASSFEIQAEDGRRYLVAVAPISTGPESGVESPEPGDETEPLPAADADAPNAGAFDDGRRATDDGRRATDDGQSAWSVVTWSDVTQLSEMQEQLARSRRLATVGQLAAGVAHEINNPLAAITTCAEATQRDLRSLPDLAATARERNWNFYLEEIVRQALRCKSITRGLLDLARQRRARRESCDLNALVGRAVRLFEERTAADAPGEGARVHFSLSLDEAAGEVATDEGMVRQILDNLLTNAVDALGGAGEIAVSTESAGARVRLEVADTGPGIPPEVLVRIFEPFFTTKEAGKGSGLGLAIATTLAEALGGALTVESKLGAGSRFRLWLPRRAPERRDEG